MSTINWLEVLGWGSDELEDLRFVGYSYIKQGKYDIAITFFEALAVLAPESAYDLQTLGGLYLQKNNNLMALNYIERAIALAPDHYPTLLNRTKALFALGYKNQAIAQARNLVKSPDVQIANHASALILAYT
ncbi:MAG TPA: type III secretion chaperone [Rhabdochlamydiaceae bacterium]|nr:type III secretion chaperone [Rhabdochlamydiaceae bacterium]